MGPLCRAAMIGALLAVSQLAPIGDAPGAVAAGDWVVVPGESRILFDYERNGAPAEGRFTAFAGEGRFDAAEPGTATLELRIESASIDLGDPVESAFATSAEWFDSANHPLVVYRLLALTPEADGRYRAEGELTIRGRTRQLETPLTLEIGGPPGAETARASGDLQLDRTDFLLGVGPMALFVDIGRGVAVRFELTAHPPR